MITPPPVVVGPAGAVSGAAVVFRHRGALHVTAIAKATFSFVQDGAMLQVEPDALRLADVHHEGDPARSLHGASDLSPFRERADVVLTGHAYAPPDDSSFDSAVRLSVVRGQALVDKTVHVVGDRTGGGAARLERLPLVYERSFGGAGFAENPVGTGFLHGSALPNLIDPASPRRAAGFGPLRADWAARASRLREADRASLAEPVMAVPGDIDWLYFQAAPADQQTAYLCGDEWVAIDGVHPSRRKLRSRLPGLSAVAEVHGRPGQERAQLFPMNADGLEIDADRERCSVTWRVAFGVGSDEALAGLRIVVGVEVGGTLAR